MKKHLFSVILYLFLSLLLFTGIQGTFKLIKEKELYGTTAVSDTCSPTLKSVTEGRFQQCATVWLNNHMGFRNTLVRLNNQVAFSLFRISAADIVLIGKHNVLYQKSYINSYLGYDYSGRKEIEGKVARLLELQRILERQNVHFILVFCPSKPRFMPEYLPDQIDTKGMTTNYDTYVQLISTEAKDLHFIDFSKYFLELKDTSTFTLFPKGGVHWSNFSSRFYALDSLLGYMEQLSGRTYPRIVTKRIYWSDSLFVPDDDLAEMLNLMLPFPAGKVTYADFEIDTAGAVKPDVLAIADSYYWEIYGFDKITSIFNVSDFWVWNKLRYPKSKYKNVKDDDYLFLKNDILSHQFLILMVTETNLPGLLYFDEQVYSLFDPDNPIIREMQKKKAERIEFFRRMILNDPKWSALVRQKAVDRKITFEQMLQNDAEYMVEQEVNNMKNR